MKGERENGCKLCAQEGRGRDARALGVDRRDVCSVRAYMHIHSVFFFLLSPRVSGSIGAYAPITYA